MSFLSTPSAVSLLWFCTAYFSHLYYFWDSRRPLSLWPEMTYQELGSITYVTSVAFCPENFYVTSISSGWMTSFSRDQPPGSSPAQECTPLLNHLVWIPTLFLVSYSWASLLLEWHLCGLLALSLIFLWFLVSISQIICWSTVCGPLTNPSFYSVPCPSADSSEISQDKMSHSNG